MSTTPQFVALTRSPLRGAVTLCLFVGALLAVGAAPAFASYAWCSRDPVITFTRPTAPGEVAVPQVLDLQVLEPLQTSSVGDAAELTVTLPANVAYQEVDTSLPVFPLETTFKQVLAPVTSDAYTVRLAAAVPAPSGSYPVQLMVTDPASGASVTCTGNPSQMARATVQFAPFAVACQ